MEEAQFSAFMASGASLTEEFKENLGAPKVRKELAKISENLAKLGEFSESSTLAFCASIPLWFRLLSGYPKHRKLIMKSLISIWSSSSEHVRVQAAVSLLKFCKAYPSQHENCARKMYLAFLKSCKGINIHSIHILSLMTNTLLEVFSVKIEKLACLIFSSIRKLAETVRVAIKDSSKEKLKKVFSWPFCAAIKLWGLLLARSESDQIADLLYPTVSLCMELCCFQTSNFYSPFYLQMVRIALDIMEKKQIFIPVNHILGHMLKTICARKIEGAAKITGSNYCISFMIKASASDQLNPSYKEALFEDCHTLLMKYIGISSSWACFPEVGLNCKNLLTSVLANCPHKKFKTTLSISKNKLQSLIDSTLKARVSCELPPNSYDNSHEQDAFDPVDFKAYVASLDSVQKIKEEQAGKVAIKASNLKKSPSNSKEMKSNAKISINRKKNLEIDDDKLVNFEL